MPGSARGETRRGRALRYVRQNAIAFLALFVALGGTGAYAADTIGSADIVDESILSVDLKNGQVAAADVARESLSSGRIFGLDGTDIDDGSITGADVEESTLAIGRGASSFAAHQASQPFDIGASGSQVISLRDNTYGSSGGDIVVPSGGRLLVSASIVLYNDGTDPHTALCRPRYARPGQALTTMDSWGSASRVPGDRTRYFVTVPVLGAATVGPGTYYVNVVCSGAGVSFQQGTLLAWVVPD
ncbi:MAG TPA: hypothetical protein VF533_08755 [Solirubrobacteraceae bacterium]|jgi:hypothetical protein